jgi:hypothetical protein
VSDQLQRHLPEFSVLRALLQKKYAEEKEEKDIENERATFRARLLVLMSKYLTHAPSTAERVRYDGCTMLKGVGDLQSLLSQSSGDSLNLCDLPLLSLLSSSSTQGMYRWGNFLKRVQLVLTGESQKNGSSRGDNSLRQWVANSVGLFPNNIEVTPLRPVFLTMALSPSRMVRSNCRSILSLSLRTSGGVFSHETAHDDVRSFLAPPSSSNSTVPMALFLDACLSRSVRDPLEMVLAHPSEVEEWGVFVVVVVDTLRIVLSRCQEDRREDACRDVVQYAMSSLEELGERREDQKSGGGGGAGDGGGGGGGALMEFVGRLLGEELSLLAKKFYLTREQRTSRSGEKTTTKKKKKKKGEQEHQESFEMLVSESDAANS